MTLHQGLNFGGPADKRRALGDWLRAAPEFESFRGSGCFGYRKVRRFFADSLSGSLGFGYIGVFHPSEGQRLIL